MGNRVRSFPGSDYLRSLLARYRHVNKALFEEVLDLHGPPLTGEAVNHVSPIFVLSTGRCGTKWMTENLSLSKQVYITHEPIPRLFLQSVDAYHSHGENQELFVKMIRAARDDLMAVSVRSNRLYIETNNRLSFLAPAIAEAYPNSKFMHLFRHPADFVRSAMRRNYYGGNQFDSSRISMEDKNSWGKLSQFEKSCWLWNETNAYICDFLDKMPMDRKIKIQSEKMWSEQESMPTIMNFMGVSDISQESIYQLQKKRVNIQKSGKFVTYQDWSGEQKQQLQKWCPLAAELGYDLE